jgi:hypothetical protein
MFSFIEANWWSIVLILVTAAILFGLQYVKPNEVEGFTVQKALKGYDQVVVCPMLKNNITTNTGLIEGFTEQHAVTSLERTNFFINTLKRSYDEYDCDTYFQSLASSQEITVEKADEKE